MTMRLFVYAAAVLLGLETVYLVLPLDSILGAGPGWNPPRPDQAQALAGHLAFQSEDWRWPLLDTRRLFWPRGISIALTDSNPLFSLAAKVWTHATGGPPVNVLGVFLALCWLLQPVAAVYAARALHVGPLAALVAGVLGAAWPAMLFRMGHLNLCAHFTILLALGLAMRRVERGGWSAPALLLVLAVLTHPYLFQICAVVLAAIPLHAALRRGVGWRREVACYLGSVVLAIAVFSGLSGVFGGSDRGFTHYSMNLISPLWPQISGVFGARLPVIDATGGQYEGFNWIGAGALLLLVCGLPWAIATAARPWARPAPALAVILACLFAVSLSSRVYAGPYKLLDLGDKPWEDIFGSFRSSGRAFWPVGYAIMLGGVAVADRMARPIGGPLLLLAAVLQVVDVRPLLASARHDWQTPADIVGPAIPAGTSLFTVAPFPGCARDAETKRRGPVMLLDAVRLGARTGDVGIGRAPRWFSCERILSDALELPLERGELRAYFEAAAQDVRPERLGADAVCRRQADIVLCGRAAGAFEGMLIAPGAAPLPAPLPLALDGTAMASALGSGWTLVSGEAWSEGPRATLVIPVQPGRALTITLHAAGIAASAGASRTVGVSIGRVEVGAFDLADEKMAEIAIRVPAAATRDGVLRLAFDFVRPLDPSKRALTAPVRRAAIRLAGLALAADQSPPN